MSKSQTPVASSWAQARLLPLADVTNSRGVLIRGDDGLSAIYEYDASSAAAESLPDVVTCTAGGRFLLVTPRSPTPASGGGLAGLFSVSYTANKDGTGYSTGDAITGSWTTDGTTAASTWVNTTTQAAIAEPPLADIDLPTISTGGLAAKAFTQRIALQASAGIAINDIIQAAKLTDDVVHYTNSTDFAQVIITPANWNDATLFAPVSEQGHQVAPISRTLAAGINVVEVPTFGMPVEAFLITPPANELTAFSMTLVSGGVEGLEASAKEGFSAETAPEFFQKLAPVYDADNDAATDWTTMSAAKSSAYSAHVLTQGHDMVRLRFTGQAGDTVVITPSVSAVIDSYGGGGNAAATTTGGTPSATTPTADGAVAAGARWIEFDNSKGTGDVVIPQLQVTIPAGSVPYVMEDDIGFVVAIDYTTATQFTLREIR